MTAPDTLAAALAHQSRTDAARHGFRADYERAQVEDDGWITVYVTRRKEPKQ